MEGVYNHQNQTIAAMIHAVKHLYYHPVLLSLSVSSDQKELFLANIKDDSKLYITAGSSPTPYSG